MALTVVQLETSLTPSINTSGGGKRALADLENLLAGVAAGAKSGSSLQVLSSAVKASGTVTFSGASGTVGSVINGVTITAAHGASDAADAIAHAAAINASADALISGVVTAAVTASGVVTITAVNAGVTGNTITITASGTGVTASGARLTGGSQTRASLSL